MRELIIFIGILSFACSSVRIKDVTKADGFSLSKYKTFGFFQVEAKGDALGPNYESNLELLKKEIISQMNAKGLTLLTDNPDLMINIGIVILKKVQTTETRLATDHGYMGQRNYTWKAQEVRVGTYKQGSVTVDIVDRAAGVLVWQGTAESIVPEKEKNVLALIKEGLGKLFEKIR